MAINSAGLDIVKRYEGLRLKAYADPVGIWTIGYGHTAGVKRGDVVTEAEAEAFLESDLREAEDSVDSSVLATINPNQRAALVSLTFNIGTGAFRKSTLLRKLNAEDYEGAANEFRRWNKAGGKVLNGLTARRAAEEELFRRQIKPLVESRTMKAAAGATAATTTIAVAQVVQTVTPTISIWREVAQVAPVVAVIALIVFIGWIVYSRWDDWKNSVR